VATITSDCDPIITVDELGIFSTVGGVVTLPSGSPANPCGLVAKSVFNDTFLLYSGAGTTDNDATSNPAKYNVTINSTGIAWDSDLEYKFKNMAN